MALVEIEDTALGRLRSFEEMFDKIGKSSDRLNLLKLVKAHFPDVPIPEVDAAKPVYDEIDKIRAELAAEREARAKDKAEREEEESKRVATRSIADSRRQLREEGWDDEGIEQIETHMRSTGNPHYESAAAYVRSKLPATPDNMPNTMSGQRWDWFRAPDADVDHKLLLKNPKAYQDAVVSSWLKETRQQRQRG
jgi:hypothetical protein